ncbi:Hsp20/alpha crystallin family protein [Abyssalbus ytuae]|uniref:Hsp20/alpha crystallin family protein n=1 Tax=Abyssalbus ytuae TaxID=2926907 RepID=A0A9E7D1F7_9FLAO|nr:Hsp20/alpha crystallin family protein [Abyssalbus ytuae]UOB17048.1 Hsp20/alpha crystallin family protein [Abyssalbus ytuae]
MSLIKRNPVVTLPSLFDEFFKPDWLGGMESFNSTVPAVNVKETDNNFSIELAVPGMKKDDFNVEVDENILTISAETKTEKEDKAEDGKYMRKEFSYSTFKRSFTLPETVNDEEIKASYEDGVLKLVLPKREEALPKPKRLIEIG